MRIKSYNEYLSVLEGAIVANNKHELTDFQIGQFIKSNNLDVDWNIYVSEVKTDMCSIVKRLNSKPVLAPKPNYAYGKDLSMRVANAKKVKSYTEYMQLLETAFLSNGKKSLIPSQINDFIKTNKLDVEWGILYSEVYKDMSTIWNKYRGNVNNTPNSSNGNSYKQTNTNKYVKTYAAYMQLLENAIHNNSSSELTANQIKRFISENRLESDWGITPEEIRTDMKSIMEKNARREKIEDFHRKSETGPIATNVGVTNADIKQDIPFNVKKKTGLTDEDKHIASVLRDMMKKYPDIVGNNKRLKAAIADMLPGKKKEVNLLGALVEEDIIQAIYDSDSLNQILCNRFIAVLEENYGTTRELGQRMVLIWFHSYGRLILNKDIE